MVAQWKDYKVKPFFNAKSFRENFKAVITEDENVDKHGNKDMFSVNDTPVITNREHIFVSDDWGIIVYFNNSGEFSDDETVQMNIDEIVDCAGSDIWGEW